MPAEGQRSLVAPINIRRDVFNLDVHDQMVLARAELRGEGVIREGYHLRTPVPHVLTQGARKMIQKQIKY